MFEVQINNNCWRSNEIFYRFISFDCSIDCWLLLLLFSSISNFNLFPNCCEIELIILHLLSSKANSTKHWLIAHYFHFDSIKFNMQIPNIHFVTVVIFISNSQICQTIKLVLSDGNRVIKWVHCIWNING